MNKKKRVINKQSLINHLEYKGIDLGTSDFVVTALLEYIRDNLIKGNTVNLPRTCLIKPIRVEGKEAMVFGELKPTNDRLKLKITTSQTLSDYYKKRKKAGQGITQIRHIKIL